MRWSRATRVGASVIAVVCSAPAAYAEPRSGLRLVVSIADYAAVGRTTLDDAVSEAARIFAPAGIRWIWQRPNRTPGADATLGDLVVRVILLDREMTDRKGEADGINGRTLAVAGRATRIVYVFAPRVIREAERWDRAPAIMLGRVMAHEVGHVLLPEASHSDVGIMQESVPIVSRLTPRFTAHQAAQLRKAFQVLG